MPKMKLLEVSGNITTDFITPINALRQIKLTSLTEKELTQLSTEMDKIKNRFEERKKVFADKKLQNLKDLAKELGYTITKKEQQEQDTEQNTKELQVATEPVYAE